MIERKQLLDKYHTDGTLQLQLIRPEKRLPNFTPHIPEIGTLGVHNKGFIKKS